MVARYRVLELDGLAIDADFLDSSPLVAPARFVRVLKGTELITIGAGGVFFGDLYWQLSASGGESIYVYNKQLKRDFRVVRAIRK